MKQHIIEKQIKKQMVIVGAGEFASMAYECFTKDSAYTVKAFAVERQYRNEDSFYGLPLIDFENMEEQYPPGQYDIFVAVTHIKLNTVRSRLYHICKEKGYRCASYVSSHSFLWDTVKVGENVFIFEGVTIQHFAEIQYNVVIWNGVNIAHRTIIGENCWIAPAAAIAGFVRIGKGCFIGTNVTIGDRVTVPAETVIGAGSVVYADLNEAGRVYVGNPAKMLERTSYEQFHVE